MAMKYKISPQVSNYGEVAVVIVLNDKAREDWSKNI
jgi:hypothetical protein